MDAPEPVLLARLTSVALIWQSPVNRFQNSIVIEPVPHYSFPDGATMKRWFAIAQRWIDLFILAIFGGAGAFVFSRVFSKELAQSRVIFAHFADLSAPVLLVATLVATLFVIRIISAVEDLRVSHFRVILCYPPTLAAVPLAIPIFFGFAVWFTAALGTEMVPAYSLIDWILAAGFLLVAFILFRTWRWLGQWSETDGNVASSNSDHLWLANDEPIARPEDDRFGRRPVAQRIVRRLDHGAKAIGLVGEWGEGKSSIINLVEFETKSTQREFRVWLAKVSCWGFDNANAIVRHILHAAVECVNEYVDCSHLRGIPESYRRAISATGTFDRLLRLLAIYDDPMVQLRRLSPVLIAVNARLVIVVEDLDRNESREFDSAQVVAMLHRLRTVDRVTFILAGRPRCGHAHIDFAKLCDRIEPIAPLQSQQVWQQLDTIYRDLSADAAVIDPIRESRTLFGSASDVLFHQLDRTMIEGCMVELVRSPRALKHTLRQITQTWTHLKGEIDLDDLFVSSVLRFGAPEAYDFVLQNIRTLRSSESNEPHLSDKRDEGNQRQLRDAWNKSSADASWNSDHALELVLFLFPDATRFFRDARGFHRTAPQGVHHDSPVDYWARLNAGELGPADVTDQTILNWIDRWNASGEADLLDNMYESQDVTSRFEHFLEFSPKLLEDDRLLSLAQAVAERILEREGPDAGGDHFSLIAVWRRANRRLRGAAENEEWLRQRLLDALPKSIRLANDWFNYWASYRYGIVDQDVAGRLRKCMFDAANSVFSEPENLIAALGTPDHAYRLFHLVFTARSNDEEQPPLTSPTDWQWFAPILLKAAVINPRVVTPQIAGLVSQYRDRPEFTNGTPIEYREWYIDDEVVNQMFGEYEEPLFACLGAQNGWYEAIPITDFRQIADLARRRLCEQNTATNE